MAVPLVRTAVPVVRVTLLSVAPVAVRLPAFTVVTSPTIPVIVVLPPVRVAKPVMLAALLTVPFD